MTRLSSLQIHTVGTARGCLSDIPEADVCRYKEYGHALNTFAKTLRTLTFKQEMNQSEWPNQDGYRFCRTRIEPLDWSKRPMDVLFADYTLPHIMSTKWDQLQSLILRGIGELGSGFVERLDRETKLPAYYRSGSLEELKSALKGLLGQSVHLTLEKSTLEPLDSGEEFCGDGLQNLLDQ